MTSSSAPCSQHLLLAGHKGGLFTEKRATLGVSPRLRDASVSRTRLWSPSLCSFRVDPLFSELVATLSVQGRAPTRGQREVGMMGKLKGAEESRPKDHVLLSLGVNQTRRLVCRFLGRSRFLSLSCETVNSCMKGRLGYVSHGRWFVIDRSFALAVWLRPTCRVTSLAGEFPGH